MADQPDQFEEIFAQAEQRSAAVNGPDRAKPEAGTGNQAPQHTSPASRAPAQRSTAAVKAKRTAPASPANRTGAPGGGNGGNGKKVVSRKRKPGNGCSGGLTYLVFVVSLSIIIACLTWVAATDILALNKESRSAQITLSSDQFTESVDEEGETVQSADINYVSRTLKENGIINYPWLFRIYCRVTNAAEKLDPGTYELSSNYDYRALVNKMQSGSDAMVALEVTIPEGYTMQDIFQLLDESGICDYDALMDAAANETFNYTFLDSSQQGDASRLEGYLFPDTYEFYSDSDAGAIIGKMLDNFATKFTEEMINAAKDRGYSLKDIVTIASYIEKEATGSDEDRANIASVIYNRLDADEPLGLDSTILYTHQDAQGEPMEEMLQEDTPYNTRLHSGLTPTPICNPGMSCISAALNPAQTDYFYFFYDKTQQKHIFFESSYDFEAYTASD